MILPDHTEEVPRYAVLKVERHYVSARLIGEILTRLPEDTKVRRIFDSDYDGKLGFLLHSSRFAVSQQGEEYGKISVTFHRDYSRNPDGPPVTTVEEVNWPRDVDFAGLRRTG
jgi:hypothetical protein